jgi:aspartyl/asparaginyl beta-hydroxylase (cupin superfamily)
LTDQTPTTVIADEASRALWAGDAASAAVLYRQLTERDPKTPDHWIGLAVASRRAGDRAGELEALDAALAIEPRLLTALLLKGVHLEDGGDPHGASDMFRAALLVAPPPDRLSADLIPLIRRAQAVVSKTRAAQEAFYKDGLADLYRELGEARTARFAESVDVHLGRKAVYRQNPHNFYFPGLPETQFYDRNDFPWLATIEAATEAIRAEFERVWSSDHGSTPYIAYPPGVPVDQWAELNHSSRWSVFHLIKDSREVSENAARCPNTLAALADVPAPALVNRSPNAMFSLLAPRTRIPPHTGDTNVRLIVHIPLIVPERTGFRVGNDTRPWRVGEALIFNDTIEHEAWNDSDHLRAVLIFDIWHPALTHTERLLVDRLMALTDTFRGRTTGLGL